MKQLLPLTKRDRRVALLTLDAIHYIVTSRLRAFQRNTLTYKELASVIQKIDQMKTQVRAWDDA